jgi:acylphosphatase
LGLVSFRVFPKAIQTSLPPNRLQAARMAAKTRAARRWLIRGSVQGVGFRYFAQQAASALGLTGYARNLDDGSVEVYAAGAPEKLSDFSGRLRQGPRWADVRGVEEQEAAVQQYGSFEIQS